MRIKVYKRRASTMYQAYCFIGGRMHRRSMRTVNRREAESKARQWARDLQEDDEGRQVRGRVMLSETLTEFLHHCQEHDLARSTVRGYRGRLTMFLARTGDRDVASLTEARARELVGEYLDARAREVASLKHDRLPLSALFNYLKARGIYHGENPASAVLHRLRKPRRKMQKQKRCTTVTEDLALRREGQESILWPVLLLSRWAGMRRGEACTVRWSDLELDKGYADVVGHEGGRKHPRRVPLAPWVVMQLRLVRPAWLPHNGECPVWSHHPDTATDALSKFCDKHLARRLAFNDLRASFVTDCQERGITSLQESRIVGHSSAVADKHYSEFDAMNARDKLPPDPLGETGLELHSQNAGSDAGPDAESHRVAQSGSCTGG